MLACSAARITTNLEGYRRVTAAGRLADRVGLHQLYPLLAHAALFGGGYRNPVSAATQSALKVS